MQARCGGPADLCLALPSQISVRRCCAPSPQRDHAARRAAAAERQANLSRAGAGRAAAPSLPRSAAPRLRAPLYLLLSSPRARAQASCDAAAGTGRRGAHLACTPAARARKGSAPPRNIYTMTSSHGCLRVPLGLPLRRCAERRLPPLRPRRATRAPGRVTRCCGSRRRARARPRRRPLLWRHVARAARAARNAARRPATVPAAWRAFRTRCALSCWPGELCCHRVGALQPRRRCCCAPRLPLHRRASLSRRLPALSCCEAPDPEAGRLRRAHTPSWRRHRRSRRKDAM